MLLVGAGDWILRRKVPSLIFGLNIGEHSCGLGASRIPPLHLLLWLKSCIHALTHSHRVHEDGIEAARLVLDTNDNVDAVLGILSIEIVVPDSHEAWYWRRCGLRPHSLSIEIEDLASLARLPDSTDGDRDTVLRRVGRPVHTVLRLPLDVNIWLKSLGLPDDIEGRLTITPNHALSDVKLVLARTQFRQCWAVGGDGKLTESRRHIV